MVNPAIFAASAAANAARRTARQTLLARFATARAYDVSSAIALDQSPGLTELVGRAIVRPRGGGYYYLDRERQREQAAGQGWLALAILLAIASVMASLIALVAS